MNTKKNNELSTITESSNSETCHVIKAYATIVDEDNNTILHYHAAKNEMENLLKEIESGHKIDPENYLGWTPLMMAARKGNLNVVKLMLLHRADATKKNRFGVSVFSVSVTSGNLEMVSLLLQHLLTGGVSRQSLQSVISPISLAVLFSHIDILNYLIFQSFDLNCPTPITGITPLMFASAMENVQAFSLLIAKNADPNIKNCLGTTVHEMSQYNKTKELTPTTNPVLPVPQIPLIFVSPNTPNHLYPNSQIRKSSNVTLTPNCFPLISPIAGVGFPHAQVFFPPNFSPRQHIEVFSPTTHQSPDQYYNLDILNTRLYSPMFSQYLREDVEH